MRLLEQERDERLYCRKGRHDTLAGKEFIGTVKQWKSARLKRVVDLTFCSLEAGRGLMRRTWRLWDRDLITIPKSKCFGARCGFGIVVKRDSKVEMFWAPLAALGS